MSEYTECMIPFMKGPKQVDGITAMCIGAKICTGKARNQDEAIEICKSQPPPVPRSSKRGLNAELIAACLAPKLTGSITVAQLAKFLSECSGKAGGPRIKKPDSRNKFLKACVAAGGGGAEAPRALTAKLIKACEIQWRQRNNAVQGPAKNPSNTDEIVSAMASLWK